MGPNKLWRIWSVSKLKIAHCTQRKYFNFFFQTGKPPSSKAWLAQCGVYILLMIVEKVLITLLVQFEFWESVSHLILAPVGNPKLEVTLVMLIIPFFVNVRINFTDHLKYLTNI